MLLLSLQKVKDIFENKYHARQLLLQQRQAVSNRRHGQVEEEQHQKAVQREEEQRLEDLQAHESDNINGQNQD